MNSLQPRRSPRNATLLPMTGPRSMTTEGSGWFFSAERNFGKAFDGTMASAPLVGAMSAGSGPVRRPHLRRSDSIYRIRRRIECRCLYVCVSSRPPNREGPVYRLTARGADEAINRYGDTSIRRSAIGAGGRRIRRGRRGRGRGGGRLDVGLLGGLSGRTRLLHVDTAAEVRALGNRHTRGGDVAVDRAVVANVDLLACRDVARHLAEDDHGLGEHRGLDTAVGADRQHVLPQLDLAFDLSFDRQIFAAVELTLDDDRFANIHGLVLQSSLRLSRRRPRLRGGIYSRRLHRLRRRWGGGRLASNRLRRFIAFPHKSSPPVRKLRRVFYFVRLGSKFGQYTGPVLPCPVYASPFIAETYGECYDEKF